MTRTLADAEIEIGQIRAENERLREALERLSTAECFGDMTILGKQLSSLEGGSEILARMVYARAALNPQEDAE